ncbi:MAG TPA: dTDP-4-dehydrorhamnose 3,5-epimerase [Cytophagaceae bacterium]
MEFKEHYIKGVIEITPKSFKDDRGFFFESYNKKAFEDHGLPFVFVQDNQSFSIKNVVRGLHFQNPPYAQGKLVRAVTGKILDVAVDIQKDSPTFGKYVAVVLDSRINNMLYIPEGFAHGFAALEESIVMYKCTNLYNKSSECGIIWNDETLNIDWGVQNPIISEKDKELKSLVELFGVTN